MLPILNRRESNFQMWYKQFSSGRHLPQGALIMFAAPMAGGAKPQTGQSTDILKVQKLVSSTFVALIFTVHDGLRNMCKCNQPCMRLVRGNTILPYAHAVVKHAVLANDTIRQSDVVAAAPAAPSHLVRAKPRKYVVHWESEVDDWKRITNKGVYARWCNHYNVDEHAVICLMQGDRIKFASTRWQPIAQFVTIWEDIIARQFCRMRLFHERIWICEQNYWLWEILVNNKQPCRIKLNAFAIHESVSVAST